MEWFPIPLARYCCRTILLKWRVCQIGTLIFMSEWWVSCKQRMTWQKHVAFHSPEFWPRRKTNPSSASSHLIWQHHIRKPPIFRSTAVLKRNGGSCGIPKTKKKPSWDTWNSKKAPPEAARCEVVPSPVSRPNWLPVTQRIRRAVLWTTQSLRWLRRLWHAVIGKNWYIWYYLILFDQMEIDDALAVKFWL